MEKKQLHKPKWLVTMLLLVMAILMPYGGAWAQTRPAKGNGDVDNPFQISKAAELAWFRDYVNGKIVNEGEKDGTTHPSVSAKLTENIDLSEFCHAASTTYTQELSWTPIGNSGNNYQGTFDGNGKTISNLYINAISENIGITCDAGFFGYATGGSIKNITFDNAKVMSTGNYCTGVLAGVAGSCIENIKILTNCSVEGEDYVGGIVGDAKGSIIGNCENHAKVDGTNYVGGIVGDYELPGKSITSCANYGVVTGTGESVGGIAGYFNSGTLQNSANYGDVTGAFYVGNLIGNADECNLNNVLGTGNVTATWDIKYAGLLVGSINNSSSTASGILAYNSSAKLTINGTEQTGEAVKAIGEGSMTSAEKIKAFTAEQLKSGLVANLLQKNASGSAKWGQKLNTDTYPILGSAEEVYLDGNVTLNCSGDLTGTLSNTKPAQEGTFMMQHGDSPIHHAFVAATCTTDGNIEYWECDVCHASFSNEQLTQEVSTLVVSATGHEYDENDKCTKCQKEIPFLTLGNKAITIEKVLGTKEEISGYNLYKYTATENGTLEVTANSNGEDTYGSLWESRTAASYLTYNDDVNGRDFKITYNVTAGTTYYIGAREYRGNAIEGNVMLNVKLNGLDRELPTGMTGYGTEAKPFVLKTAEHLAWFRDYVNEGHPNAWAKIADDVKEIDMSTVCHEADAATNTEELSWTPIGNSKENQYQGTFDGNGKTISNLYIKASSDKNGFFAGIMNSSIKNITFDNAKVQSTGDYNTGILAGYASFGMIKNIKTLANCSVEGKGQVGGIAGYANGDIINCENHAVVKGTASVGGIVASYNSPDNSITSCANYGAVTSTESQAGGIVGYFVKGTIQNSANYGNIMGSDVVGNLIGNAYICNLNNVLGTGNVTAVTDAKYSGLLIGFIAKSSSSTASGILAYNSSAKLTINKIEQTDGAVKAIGQGSLTYPEGKNEADVIKAFTAEQLKSGEVAYLLNGSTSEGKLAWYQKLSGTDADAYPVLTAAEGNTVYSVACDYCYKDDKFTKYGNDPTLKSITYHDDIEGVEFDADKHIYQKGCRNENCPEHKYVADEDGKLEATKSTDGKFYVEKLALTDASTAINTQAKFTVKDLQYSRQLTEGQTGYVTLSLPFDINVADVTGAEKCYPVGDMMIHMPTNDASVLKFVLMLDEQSVIKAGTPMIVKLGAEGTAQKLVAKAQNVEYSADFFANPAAKSLTLRDWDGKTGFMTLCHELESASIGGVYTTTPMAEGSYSFREDGKFGIHTGDLSPYRMYLNVQPSQSASSRTMLFSIGLPDDSSTTGIRIISLGDGKQTGSSAIYTLEGQRVMGTPRKGIYIKNGKKFSVK